MSNMQDYGFHEYEEDYYDSDDDAMRTRVYAVYYESLAKSKQRRRKYKHKKRLAFIDPNYVFNGILVKHAEYNHDVKIHGYTMCHMCTDILLIIMKYIDSYHPGGCKVANSPSMALFNLVCSSWRMAAKQASQNAAYYTILPYYWPVKLRLCYDLSAGHQPDIFLQRWDADSLDLSYNDFIYLATSRCSTPFILYSSYSFVISCGHGAVFVDARSRYMLVYVSSNMRLQSINYMVDYVCQFLPTDYFMNLPKGMSNYMLVLFETMDGFVSESVQSARFLCPRTIYNNAFAGKMKGAPFLQLLTGDYTYLTDINDEIISLRTDQIVHDIVGRQRYTRRTSISYFRDACVSQTDEIHAISPIYVTVNIQAPSGTNRYGDLFTHSRDRQIPFIVGSDFRRAFKRSGLLYYFLK